MDREDRIVIFKMALTSIIQTMILPILGLTFNVYLIDREFTIGLNGWQMLYIGAIARLMIFIITRTVKYDWRD